LDPIDVKFLGAGGNWVNLCSLIALGLNGYYSPLPKGSTVSVTTSDRGPACTDAPLLVAAGKYHMAITTPAWYGRAAYEGKAPFDKKLPIRALAVFQHDDRLVFAVRKETGIKSIADIAARKYPLKFSTPAPEMRHPAGIVAEMICKEYGFSFADIEKWGGKLLRDRPRNQNHPDSVPVNPEFDAVFDEAIMTRRWPKLTEKYDLEFLPVDKKVVDKMVGLGMQAGVLAKGRLKGVEQDVPTIDFSGWLLFCHADIPDDLAYFTMQAIEAQKAEIEARFPRPFSGMTGEVDFKKLADAPLPLHPGAERFYRERGCLK